MPRFTELSAARKKADITYLFKENLLPTISVFQYERSFVAMFSELHNAHSERRD